MMSLHISEDELRSRLNGLVPLTSLADKWQGVQERLALPPTERWARKTRSPRQGVKSAASKSTSRRRMTSRVLILSTVAVVVVVALGIGIFESVTHLGKQQPVLVITDGSKSTAGFPGTASHALLANPYPPGLPVASAEEFPAGPYPRHRESTWAKDLSKAILRQYSFENWVVVSALEYFEVGPSMVIKIEPGAADNAPIDAGETGNGSITVTITRQERPLAIDKISEDGALALEGFSSSFGDGFVVADPAGLLYKAYLLRADQLQVTVSSQILKKDAKPFWPPLGQNGVRGLAEFVASAIQRDDLPVTSPTSGTTLRTKGSDGTTQQEDMIVPNGTQPGIAASGPVPDYIEKAADNGDPLYQVIKYLWEHHARVVPLDDGRYVIPIPDRIPSGFAYPTQTIPPGSSSGTVAPVRPPRFLAPYEFDIYRQLLQEGTGFKLEQGEDGYLHVER